MKSFDYSTSGGGSCRVDNRGTALVTMPSFLRMTIQSITAAEDDLGVEVGLVTEDGIERVLTPDEWSGVRAAWADIVTLFGPTPVYAVNADGVFQGGVHDLTGLTEVPSAAPSQEHRWINGQWELPVALADLQEDLMNAIDRAAGAQRAKYITVAPGQDATYIVKAQQALEFLADPTSTVPLYINAESQATGMSPVDAATLINHMAEIWGTLGPAIEQARRAGNIAVQSATTNAEALSAYQMTISELSVI